MTAEQEVDELRKYLRGLSETFEGSSVRVVPSEELNRDTLAMVQGFVRDRIPLSEGKELLLDNLRTREGFEELPAVIFDKFQESFDRARPDRPFTDQVRSEIVRLHDVGLDDKIIQDHIISRDVIEQEREEVRAAGPEVEVSPSLVQSVEQEVVVQQEVPEQQEERDFGRDDSGRDGGR